MHPTSVRSHTCLTLAAAALAICTSLARAEFEMSSLAQHPAGEALQRILDKPADFSGDLEPTAITKKDYLALIAGNVDHWKSHQNASGAIIDPVSKGERQYSTPAFALAAGLLVAESDRKDLLDPAIRAMTFATRQLAAGKSADGHADFYTPMLIHARRILKPLAPTDVVAQWDEDLRSIEPTKIYNMRLKGMNWNLVSSTGELLRRQDSLVAPEQLKPQWDYLEERLADHAKSFTKFGLYADPGVPLAYDAFSRLWLDDLMANGAYDGATAKKIDEFLRDGGLSTLLLLSPSGEWPSGGRSAHHNWCEAQIIAICEIHAKRWQRAGQPQIAGAFKRAARLALQSMQRWQRPSGELNIIKNRFEPEKRFAYEGYSNHSQYNLLPMAMLAIAYQHADESIQEQPVPSETSAYVFDMRDTFHKVVAAAGGYYIQIDTAADPHYNATGLQRVHRRGVPFPPFNDSATQARGYGKNDGPSETLVPGLRWKVGSQETWRSVGDAVLADPKKPLDEQPNAVREASLEISPAGDAEASFELKWSVVGSDVVTSQRFTLNASGLTVTERVATGFAFSALQVVVPVTLFDGVEESKVETRAGEAMVSHRGSKLRWKVQKPLAEVQLSLTRSAAHPGYLQPLVAELPPDMREVTWSLTLE